MDRTSYSNRAKGWEFAEESPLNQEPDQISASRRQALEEGFGQCSVAEGAFLEYLAAGAGAESIISVGTGSVVQALRLIAGLHGHGQFTAVDSSQRGASLIKKAFQSVDDSTGLRLRAVNTQAGTYFTRLNPADYDMIVIAGESKNYRDASDHAGRLLRPKGQLVFTDAFCLCGDEKAGGLMDPADRSEKSVTLRTLLDSLADDAQTQACLLPVGSGMALVTRI